MEEEILKRNTDCVYFLASPLTCKKGVECEYRHSDIARLNMRDCWYWLAGGCLNPACAFRHPPLDNCNEASSESALLPSHLPGPVNKTNVPCYFYFNAFCNKGEKCSFLHGPERRASAGKSSNSTSVVSHALALENKTSTGSDAGTAPTEAPSIPSQNVVNQNEDVQLPDPISLKEGTASPQRSASEYEEHATDQSGTFLEEEFCSSRSRLCTYQNSEELPDSYIYPDADETWRSSPGLDVLVDDRSENLEYGDDPEYVMAFEREDLELGSHFLRYACEKPDEYDPAYPAAGLYERGIYNAYSTLNNIDYVRSVPGYARGLMSDSMCSRKREPLSKGRVINSRSVDLRQRLIKRRVIDEGPRTPLSRSVDKFCMIHRIKERSHRHVMDRLQKRLASEVRHNIIRPLGINMNFPNGAYQHGWLKGSHRSRSTQLLKEKRLNNRRFIPPEVSSKVVSRKRRPRHESSSFAGPKTLAEIRDEKKKVSGNRDYLAKKLQPSTSVLQDFQGPKPLCEILKGKMKPGTMMGGNLSD